MPSTSQALAATVGGGLIGLILLSIGLACAILLRNRGDRIFYGMLFSILGFAMLALAATGGSWLGGNLNRSYPAHDLPVDAFDIVLITEANDERICVDVYKEHRTGCTDNERILNRGVAYGDDPAVVPAVGVLYYIERVPVKVFLENGVRTEDRFLLRPVPENQLN